MLTTTWNYLILSLSTVLFIACNDNSSESQTQNEDVQAAPQSHVYTGFNPKTKQPCTMSVKYSPTGELAQVTIGGDFDFDVKDARGTYTEFSTFDTHIELMSGFKVDKSLFGGAVILSGTGTSMLEGGYTAKHKLTVKPSFEAPESLEYSGGTSGLQALLDPLLNGDEHEPPIAYNARLSCTLKQ